MSQRRWPLTDRFQRVREMDRTTLASVVAFTALILVTLFPQVWPAAQRGVECYDLAAPLGGNNRSVLAQSGNNQQNVELKLDLESESVGYNDNLKLKVTFSNTDIGPIILYLGQRQPALNNDPTVIGVRLEIRRLDDSILVNQAAPAAPWAVGDRVNVWASPEQLHLVGSRSRCTIEFSINLSQILGAALTPGDYRIRAFYNNNNGGSVRPLLAGDATATATPAYFDQGIWVGRISSEEKRFTVRSP